MMSHTPSIAASSTSDHSNIHAVKDSGVHVLRVTHPANWKGLEFLNVESDLDDHHDPHLHHDPDRRDTVHAQERPDRDVKKIIKKLHWREESSDRVPDQPVPIEITTDDKENDVEPKKQSHVFSESAKPPQKNEGPMDSKLKPNFFKRLSISSLMAPEDVETQQLEAESKSKLKEYKFIKTLGAGAQGTVSLRLHRPTSTLCALKSIPTAPSLVDSHVRESFQREVRILKLCRPHPSIIRLINSWESVHTVYQVFDVMNRGDASMSGVFEGVTEERAIRLIAPIADALRFIHGLNILHRDVRPANVFLRRPLTGHESLRELETIPVLADFGIASYANCSGRLGTPFPTTPAHIAPEVVAGARFTKTSDCYQLGYYSLHVLLHRFPSLADVQEPDAIFDSYWKNMTDIGRYTVKMLLISDPFTRWTSENICRGEWMKEFGVECV
ncbi:kinase-like domain-containing protein [Obelidium mucronatum]|nr:kinase-like domain-containing protein [Obelidium mucronatum]